MPKPTDPKKYKYLFSDDMKFVQKAIIYHRTDQRKFLAVKLSYSHAKRPNQWDLPGGNVLFGENPQESLLHEIKEETNLDVHDLKPVEVFSTTHEHYPGIYILIINYSCQANNDQVKLGEEHTEYKWVTKEEFKNLDTLTEYKNFIEKYT